MWLVRSVATDDDLPLSHFRSFPRKSQMAFAERCLQALEVKSEASRSPAILRAKDLIVEALRSLASGKVSWHDFDE